MLARRVSFLSFEQNDLVGTIPSSIGKICRLETFFAGENHQLSGPIPSELGQCQCLRRIYLSNKTMMGSIPTEWESLEFVEGQRQWQ
jgi:hypothetical protein